MKVLWNELSDNQKEITYAMFPTELKGAENEAHYARYRYEVAPTGHVMGRERIAFFKTPGWPGRSQ